MSIPAQLQEIIDDFALASRQEKVEMLIQYSESLPPLPDWLQGERAKMEPVPECMTPVFLFAEKISSGGLVFHFDIPPQSPTVRGLAAILANGLNGAQPEDVIGLPADFYAPMNLQEAISYQRLNGFQGVLSHMKQAAVRLVNP